MSEKALSRIERALEKLGDRQAAICDEIEKLKDRVDALAGASSLDPSRRRLIEFLDQFRAGEALGEASLGAWIAACKTECLRGGLRTVQMREGMHARLLAERIKELGGSPVYEVPEARYRTVMEGAGSREISDADKVHGFVRQFPDIDAALRPIQEQADRLDGDPETQSLLRTIAQDERATLEFLTDACKQLNPQD